MSAPSANLPARVGRRIRRRAEAEYRRIPRRRGLAALRAEQDRGAKLLAAAVDAAVCMRTSEEERPWVERIEDERARLNASGGHSDTLAVDDLGYAVLRKSAPKMWGLVLFHVIRTLRLESCLELGTAFGISAAFQGAALELNGGGRFVTIEGLEARAAMARETLGEVGLDWVDVRNGLFEDLLDPVLEELGSIDLAFIDGNHTEAATIAYFEQILPYVSERGVLVFDDIDWSDGMRQVWRRISNDRRLRLAVDLGRFGICLPGGPDDPPASHVVPL